ncbi:uncharacterized protein PHACADRAFT_209644 [Phanerochaete carnosa HHB-10118-sp]|uniref:Protein kinase domain-containing protein n=1 Tax=Phanerochaete carnosa (strain HHB-10118-sp) TaxID=650164 RepID=K5X063_PHACS|nr:uncharacterized protein PHACADRAFT_209644 [Phanerochaete carnosa HHB-10118-sp]EKM56157.1 hypothetical protein PHACADRAFT_209644 [Phanerochaete carnosa HHB-10118-sp]
MSKQTRAPFPNPSGQLVVRGPTPHDASRYLQRFLLTFILLLPEVDPILQSFIRNYLQLPPRATESAFDRQPNAEAAGSGSPIAHSPAPSRVMLPAEATCDVLPSPGALLLPPVPYPPTPDEELGEWHSLRSTESGSPLPIRIPDITIEGPPEEELPRYPTPPSTNPSGHYSYSSSSSTSSRLLSPSSAETLGVGLPDVQPRMPPVAEGRCEDREDRADEDPLGDWTGPPMLTHADQAYVVLGMLGEGGSGRVMCARARTGHTVAIKVVHKARAYRDPFGRENLKDEKFTWERVTHERRPFLVSLLLSWDDPENVYFVMPLYHQNLLQRITSREAISPGDFKLYAAELVAAVHNLHASGVLHRDIKPENVLLSPSGHVALADFGLAYTNWDDTACPLDRLLLADCVGTPGYFAPEVLLAGGAHGYGWPADVWALGVVLLELHLGAAHPLFWARSSADALRRMLTEDVPLARVADGALRDLLGHMLARSAQKRWSPAALMRHPYFADIDWDALQALEYMPEYVPPRPAVDRTRQSLRFDTFHRGAGVRDSWSVCLDSCGSLLPNPPVLRQLSEDRHDGRGDFRFQRPYGLLPSVRHDALGSAQRQEQDIHQ